MANENSITIPLGKVQMIVKGEYDANTTYSLLDIVSYKGSSFICKKNCKGYAPTNTEYWQLSASKGETGNGISKIEKTKTEGSKDTYTTTFTDGNTSEIVVENGTMTFIESAYYNEEGELIIVTTDEVDVKVNDDGDLIIKY